MQGEQDPSDPARSDVVVTKTPGKADNLPDGLTAEKVDQLAAEGAGKEPQQGPYVPGGLRSSGGVSTMVNGCSYSPDRWFSANFLYTCNAHDRCYSTSSYTNRYNCDQIFLAGLGTDCYRAYSGTTVRLNACRAVTLDYYAAVRSFGSSHYHGHGLNN